MKTTKFFTPDNNETYFSDNLISNALCQHQMLSVRGGKEESDEEDDDDKDDHNGRTSDIQEDGFV